jgi:hypothetical protein
VAIPIPSSFGCGGAALGQIPLPNSFGCGIAALRNPWSVLVVE